MTLVDQRPGDPAPTPPGRSPGRPVRAGPRRADLPHLGADLRLQPGLRALPVQLRPPRSRRAEHRRVQGADRRVRADADLLRQHRRRRAHRPLRLLGAGGRTPPTTTSGSSSRPTGPASPPRWRNGWPPATTWMCRSPSTGPPPRSTTPSAGAGSYATAVAAMEPARRGRLRRLQALGGGHPAQRRPARCLQGPGRPVRGPTPAHPAPPFGTGCRRLGRAPPYGRAAAAAVRLAAGPRGGRSSPATPSSTWPATASPLPGLNLCGAGRVVCLVDPVGDVYACPFAIHDEFLAGNVRSPGGFARCLAPLRPLRPSSGGPRAPGPAGPCGHYDACRGGCMAAKFFTGLPLDGPDPECVLGHGGRSLARAERRRPPGAVARPLRVPAAGAGDPAAPPARPGLRREPARRHVHPARRPADRWSAWPTRWWWPDEPRPRGSMFGPHETNLGGRPPAERSPCGLLPGPGVGGRRHRGHRDGLGTPLGLALRAGPLGRIAAGPGWAEVAGACRPHGTLVLAGLGHCGGQGSSAYSQSVLWAPSRVADVVSREMPMEMEPDDVDEVVDGFAAAARLAVDAGLDGVEIDAGPTSLLRQFHSGLTNHRHDGYGTDRLRLTGEVLGAVRTGLGHGPSCRSVCPATSWPPGPASPPTWPPSRWRPSPSWST